MRGLPVRGESGCADVPVFRQITALESRMRPVGFERDARIATQRRNAQLAAAAQRQLRAQRMQADGIRRHHGMHAIRHCDIRSGRDRQWFTEPGQHRLRTETARIAYGNDQLVMRIARIGRHRRNIEIRIDCHVGAIHRHGVDSAVALLDHHLALHVEIFRKNNTTLYRPAGFLHIGFQVLVPDFRLDRLMPGLDDERPDQSLHAAPARGDILAHFGLVHRAIMVGGLHHRQRNHQQQHQQEQGAEFPEQGVLHDISPGLDNDAGSLLRLNYCKVSRM